MDAWMEMNFLVQQGVNWILSMFDPNLCGFLYWNVVELDKPFTVEVKS